MSRAKSPSPSVLLPTFGDRPVAAAPNHAHSSKKRLAKSRSPEPILSRTPSFAHQGKEVHVQHVPTQSRNNRYCPPVCLAVVTIVGALAAAVLHAAWPTVTTVFLSDPCPSGFEVHRPPFFSASFTYNPLQLSLGHSRSVHPGRSVCLPCREGQYRVAVQGFAGTFPLIFLEVICRLNPRCSSPPSLLSPRLHSSPQGRIRRTLLLMPRQSPVGPRASSPSPPLSSPPSHHAPTIY